MSLTLNDLRVSDGPKRIRARQLVDTSRPATLADLVEILSTIGAEKLESFVHEVWHYGEGHILQVLEPGTYLVLKVDE